MKKSISRLSAKKFKKLFPITLKEYTEEYKDWYENEKNNILSVINKDDVVRINHIGSTSIPNLIAKPIIDILLEIDGSCNLSKLFEDLKTIGFGEELSTRKDPLQILLAKGLSYDGFADRVYFLHVRYFGNWSELYFRDYLIAHPEVANEYGCLKTQILEDIENGKIERIQNGQRNGYSNAKLYFVEKVTIDAKNEFKDRYRPK